MKLPPHPTDFYTAHRIFAGRSFPNGPVWGGLTDGPETRNEVIDRILSEFPEATLETLIVWRFQDDVPARDVTDDILSDVLATIQEKDE